MVHRTTTASVPPFKADIKRWGLAQHGTSLPRGAVNCKSRDKPIGLEW